MSNISLKKTLQNSGWLISEKLIRLIFGFLITTLIIKHLGPNNFGFFSYSITVASIFGLISKLGLDSILTKEFSENNSNQSEILSASLSLRIIVSLAGIILGLPIFYLQGESNTVLTLLGIFLISNIFQSYEIFESYLQSKLKNKISTIVAVFVLIISAIIRLLFLYLDLDLRYFALALLIENVLFFSILIKIIKKQGLKFVLPKFLLYRDLVRKSSPLFISSIFALIYLKVDTIMLRFMRDIEQVGIYSSAVKFSEILYFFPILISNSFFPILVNNKSNVHLLSSIFSKLLSLTLSISLLIILSLIMVSSQLVEFAYGLEYMEAATVLKIHAWSLIPITLTTVSAKLIILENKQKVFITIEFIGAFVNVVLNYFLISEFGMKGAAISTLISYTLVSFYIFVVFRCLLKRRNLQNNTR